MCQLSMPGAWLPKSRNHHCLTALPFAKCLPVRPTASLQGKCSLIPILPQFRESQRGCKACPKHTAARQDRHRPVDPHRRDHGCYLHVRWRNCTLSVPRAVVMGSAFRCLEAFRSGPSRHPPADQVFPPHRHWKPGCRSGDSLRTPGPGGGQTQPLHVPVHHRRLQRGPHPHPDGG